MTQTFKDRLREWEGVFDWINGRDLAAEADAAIASRDAEIARLGVEVRRLGGLLKGCEALSDVLRPHADRYLWLKANADVSFHEHQWFHTASGQRIHSTSPISTELDAAIDAARKKG